MATLALLCLTSPSLSSLRSLHLSSPSKLPTNSPLNLSLFRPPHLHVIRSSSDPNPNPEPDPETTPSSPPSSSSSSSDLTNQLCAALGGLGFLETTYLTFLKLTNSEAFCPTTGGSCGDILSSQYAVVFGVPLPLFGMAAYGLVAAFGVNRLSGKGLPFGVGKSEAELVLVGITTSMAAASACFLYVLNTQFPGTVCPYCLLSAFLSFSLFFVSLKEFGLEKVLKEAGLLACVAVLVAVTLNRSYSSAPVSSSPADIDLPYIATEITTPSTPFAISLAKYLNYIGAKMYGAFWCSHCIEQKQMFGREAAKELPYVECFPGGYRKGTIMAKECIDAKLEGFPTWVINGQVVSGEKDLLELAEASGFEVKEFSPTLVE